METSEKRLTILGHLAELRTRLVRSVIAIIVGAGISFAFANQIFAILTYKSSALRPVFDFLTNRLHLFAPPNISLIYIEMTEFLGVYMKVCLVGGIILAMPWLLWEVVAFVTPALTPKERRLVYFGLPWVAFMFLFGVVFTYFILLPPATRFLLTFGNEIATPQIKIGNYISLVTRLLLSVGLIFELPVLTTVLARVGVVSWRWLAGKRKWAIVLAFVLGGFITPTLDPINQSLVSVPLILLYELSIWLAWLVQRRKSKTA